MEVEEYPRVMQAQASGKVGRQEWGLDVGCEGKQDQGIVSENGTESGRQ